MEKKKTGRPTKGPTARTEKIGIRLSSSELELLTKCAEELEMTRTDTIIKGLTLLEKHIFN